MHDTVPQSKNAALRSEQMLFLVYCVEATAKKMHVSPSALYQRMDRVDMIAPFLQGDEVDILHTQSLDYITDEISTTLLDWERQDGIAS